MQKVINVNNKTVDSTRKELEKYKLDFDSNVKIIKVKTDYKKSSYDYWKIEKQLKSEISVEEYNNYLKPFFLPCKEKFYVEDGKVTKIKTTNLVLGLRIVIEFEFESDGKL